MIHQLYKCNNYIVIKDKKELQEAKKVDICKYIIMEEHNIIHIWIRNYSKWEYTKYVAFDEAKDKDIETTGFKAYQAFYNYCGKSEVERMKKILRQIELWESVEQLHYSNYNYANHKIFDTIYELDANSAFAYGTNKLPDGFQPLKCYIQEIYDKKEVAPNTILRSRYKNLINYLIGYFARIKDFVSTRSEIIRYSNDNVKNKMLYIEQHGGKVFLSNTDSIITDTVGYDIMQQYIGTKVGQFKVEKIANRLYYKSSNVYQLDDKVVYSGKKYFAKKEVDFFNGIDATQEGQLIVPFNFNIEYSDEMYSKLCRIEYGEIKVTIINKLGETIGTKTYKLEE